MNRWNAMLSVLLLSASFSAVHAVETTEYLVAWTPAVNPAVAGFVVYRSTSPDGGFSVIDSVGAGAGAYIDSGVEKGVRYYYRIRAKDSAGRRGPYSNVVGAMTIPQNADALLNDLCRITDVDETSSDALAVTWRTESPTIGFVQFDSDAVLDSMTEWDADGFSQVHDGTTVEIPSGSPCYMRAVSYDSSGLMIVSATLYQTVTGDDMERLPDAALLEQNYPNPFNPSTSISFSLRESARVSLRVYDARGGLVVILADGRYAAGRHTMQWNGRGFDGRAVESGVYFCRLVTDGYVRTRKMVLVR